MRSRSTSDDQAMAINTTRLPAADAGGSDTGDRCDGSCKHLFGNMESSDCQRISPLGTLGVREAAETREHVVLSNFAFWKNERTQQASCGPRAVESQRPLGRPKRPASKFTVQSNMLRPYGAKCCASQKSRRTGRSVSCTWVGEIHGMCCLACCQLILCTSRADNDRCVYRKVRLYVVLAKSDWIG
jgi:hypothetical protein